MVPIQSNPCKSSENITGKKNEKWPKLARVLQVYYYKSNQDRIPYELWFIYLTNDLKCVCIYLEVVKLLPSFYAP